MSLNDIHILADFAQMTGLVSGIALKLSQEWNTALNVMRLFVIRFETFLVAFSTLDARGQYILVGNILPLIVSFILVAVFESTVIKTLYFLTLLCLASIITGITFLVVPNNPAIIPSQSIIGQITISLGFIGLALLMAAAYVHWRNVVKRKLRELRADEKEFRKRKKKDGRRSVSPIDKDWNSAIAEVFENEVSDIDDESATVKRIGRNVEFQLFLAEKEAMSSVPVLQPWYYILGRALFLVVILYFGVCLVSPGSASNWIYPSGSNPPPALAGIGGFLIFLFCVLVSPFIIGFIPKGRAWMKKCVDFMYDNVGAIILTLMNILYLPVTTAALGTLTCLPYTCPVGTEFSISNYQLDPYVLAYEFGSGVYNTTCFPCTFDPNICSIASKLCPYVSDSRLASNTALSCSKEIYAYYFPGGILILIALTIGLPILFYMLINLASEVIKRIPEDVVNSKNPEDAWVVQTTLSKNSCAMLYNGFSYQWRFYAVLSIAQKLVVVIIYALAPILGNAKTLSIVMGLFGVIFLYHWALMPYVVKTENFLVRICFFLNTLNAMLSLLIASGVNVATWIIFPFGVLNIVAPLSLTVYAGVAAAKITKDVDKQLKNDEDYDDFAKRMMALLDNHVDEYSFKYIVNYFQILGVACFLSIAIIFVGVVTKAMQSNVTNPNVPIFVNGSAAISSYEFGGYANWTDFTSHCCCQVPSPSTFYTATAFSSFLNATAYQYEQWKCISDSGSFSYKFSQRMNGSSNDGFVYRPYCGMTFNTSSVCGLPVYNATVNAVVITPCNGNAETASLSLW